MNQLWHRIRGHKITTTRENITFNDYSHGGPGFVEAGYTRHRKHCSCGTTWRLVCVNPLRGEWKWQ